MLHTYGARNIQADHNDYSLLLLSCYNILATQSTVLATHCTFHYWPHTSSKCGACVHVHVYVVGVVRKGTLRICVYNTHAREFEDGRFENYNMFYTALTNSYIYTVYTSCMYIYIPVLSLLHAH